MKNILIPCIFLLMWGLEINGDTFEVLTIPYEQLFPNSHPQNGQNYQKPGFQQPHRPGYQQPHQRPNYQTQRPSYQSNYPNYQKPGAGVPKVDWECRNPSTGDMLFISSDNLPFVNTPRQPSQIPNVQPIQPTQPVQPQQPNYSGQPQVLQTTPNHNPNNPFLPNLNPTPAPVPVPSPINCNTYPQHPMCGETIILGTTTSRTPETTPNSNGEGIIDIRMRGGFPSTKNDDEDQLVFED